MHKFVEYEGERYLVDYADPHGMTLELGLRKLPEAVRLNQETLDEVTVSFNEDGDRIVAGMEDPQGRVFTLVMNAQEATEFAREITERVRFLG